jgi:hypothetical protein
MQTSILKIVIHRMTSIMTASHVTILREAKHIGWIHKNLNDGSIRTTSHIHNDRHKHHSLKYMNIYVVDRCSSVGADAVYRIFT